MFYNQHEHPQFFENEKVFFSLNHPDYPELFSGEVKGIATTGVVDTWIVHCDALQERGISLYSHCAIPHTFIIKQGIPN